MLEDAAAAYLVLAPLIATLAFGVLAVRWLGSSRAAATPVIGGTTDPPRGCAVGVRPGKRTAGQA